LRARAPRLTSPLCSVGGRPYDESVDMHAYLSEIRPAIELLLPAIWAERDELVALEAEVERLTRTVESNYAQSRAIAESDIPDDDGIATLIHWDTYFGEDKERHHKSIELADLTQRAETHSFAVAAMAGTLLQFGKQGLSIVHNGLAASPPGRRMGSQALKDVIWQGRNQGLHWEAGRFTQPVEDCFTALASDYDRKFAEFRARNMAFDVVELLEWRNFEDFASDLRGLA